QLATMHTGKISLCFSGGRGRSAAAVVASGLNDVEEGVDHAYGGRQDEGVHLVGLLGLHERDDALGGVTEGEGADADGAALLFRLVWRSCCADRGDVLRHGLDSLGLGSHSISSGGDDGEHEQTLTTRDPGPKCSQAWGFSRLKS